MAETKFAVQLKHPRLLIWLSPRLQEISFSDCLFRVLLRPCSFREMKFNFFLSVIFRFTPTFLWSRKSRAKKRQDIFGFIKWLVCFALLLSTNLIHVNIFPVAMTNHRTALIWTLMPSLVNGVVISGSYAVLLKCAVKRLALIKVAIKAWPN